MTHEKVLDKTALNLAVYQAEEDKTRTIRFNQIAPGAEASRLQGLAQAIGSLLTGDLEKVSVQESYDIVPAPTA